LNYKNEALRTLQTFPSEYTLGDVLFSAFQKEAVKNGQTISFLRNVSDEDAYTLVEKALNNLSDIAITEDELVTWVNSK
jgi:hypothetical protein